MSSPPAPAAPAAAPKKKSATAKAWGVVGVIIGVGLAIVVGFYILGGLLQPAADGIGQINSGLERVNEKLHDFGAVLTEFIMTWLKILIVPLFVALGAMWAFGGKKADEAPH